MRIEMRALPAILCVLLLASSNTHGAPLYYWWNPGWNCAGPMPGPHFEASSVEGVIERVTKETAILREQMPGYCTQIVSITPNGQAYYDPSSYLPWIIPVRVRVRAGDTYSNGSTSIRTAEPSVPPKELGTPSNCTGNPINDSNGNKFETSKDTPQIGSGTLEFNRYYNSGPLTIKNELGWGWSHNYSTRIAVAYDYATVTLPDGKTVKYNLLSNEWKRELDNSNPLIELKDSSGARTGWRLLDVSEGILSVFSPSGVLLERRYSDGTFTVLDYNCRVPDEYLLKSKRPLLFSREVLTAVVAQWTHPETTC